MIDEKPNHKLWNQMLQHLIPELARDVEPLHSVKNSAEFRQVPKS